MEKREHELISRVVSENVQLRRLYQEHEELERKLSKYENRVYLTPREEVELKKLKKEKLSGVDRMMQILAAHEGNPNAVI